MTSCNTAKKHLRLLCMGFLFVVLTLSGPSAAQTLARISVKNTDKIHGSLLCSVPLNSNLPESASIALKLLMQGKKIPLPAQINESGDLIFIIPGKYSHYERLELELESGTAEFSQVALSLTDHLEMSFEKRPVLRYHYRPLPPPAGRDSLYTRSAFIHPVWSPGGTVLSRIHPEDHIHHMGFWMPWTMTEFEGHPENHFHPEPVRIWPEGELFFGFCPVAHADWILEPGVKYVRRYRMIAYDGKMDKREIENYWDAYTASPEIQFEWLSQKL